MRRWIIGLSIFFLLSQPVFAFLYEVKILTKEEVKALSDEVLVDTYIEAKIEVDATKTFYRTSGFTPKEYAKFKELLGMIVRLRQEMDVREVKAPPVDEWLR